MLKIIGHNIWRGGEKAGWIDESNKRVYAHDGKKLGYFDSKYVYNVDGRKLAYIEGNHLYSENGGQSVSLDKINENVQGGILTEVGKAAVYVLLGG